jgi:hypothetical protein
MEKSLPHETHTRVKSTKIIYLMSLNMTLGLFVLGKLTRKKIINKTLYLFI